MNKFISRFTGIVYGSYSDFHGKNAKSHIECEWTTPEHFAHNNYERGHLPQLYIKASGWKAKLLALFFWPKSPDNMYYLTKDAELEDCIKPTSTYESRNFIVWLKNGDHPNDDVYRPFDDTGKIPTEPREGKVVRYFRHPYTSGDELCSNCHNKMRDHGWIDTEIGGHKVCPGDWIDKNLTGR